MISYKFKTKSIQKFFYSVNLLNRKKLHLNVENDITLRPNTSSTCVCQVKACIRGAELLLKVHVQFN